MTSGVRANRAANPTIQPSRELWVLTTSARKARNQRAARTTSKGKAHRFSASVAHCRSCCAASEKIVARAGASNPTACPRARKPSSSAMTRRSCPPQPSEASEWTMRHG